MQLKEWMTKNDINPAQMARILGVNYHVLYNVLRGGQPTLANAIKIINATNGKVSLEDLVQGGSS